jgi:two-component system aerobic respiration control sensor histidine kinase ArcB
VIIGEFLRINMKTKNSITHHSKNAEEHYSDLLFILDHPAMILNANGVVLDCNEAILELYALERIELINCNFFDLCKAKNLTIPFKELNKNQNASVVSISNTDNNSTSTFQWSASKIIKGKYKDSFFLEGFDISKFLIASEQEENLRKSIIDLIPNHYIFWKDKNSIYLGCNQALALTLGFTSCTEIIGKTDYDLPTPKEQSDAYRADDRAIMLSGKPKLNIEEYQTLDDGKTRVLSTSKFPLFDNQGQVYGILAVYSDITERKNLEISLEQSKNLAEAANTAKTEFLANMRHDIRTPLSGIVGFSEILKAESKEPRIKEYAENLVASSHALLHLMDEVLEAIRVGSGEIPRLKKKFDLPQTLQDVVALYTAKAHAKRLKLSFNIDNNLPHFVIGDKIRIHRIALELVGNALNFTDVGEVRLSVELAKRENRDLVIKITVTDTGMGIPKEKQQEIYVQFKRLTPSYQGIYKGTGLGLYVVKQFVDELNGEIYVDSEPHHGTSFTCLIPLQEALLNDASGIDNMEDFKTEKTYMSPMTHELFPAIDTKKSFKASKVLVVEDNFIAQEVARALLSVLTCTVDIASNGTDALELYDKNHYDLILMDIGLGDGMDGYEVTHHIRNKKNKSNHTPIIALTAHASEENKQRCIAAGMDAVLTKPLTQAYAVDILKTFIPGRRQSLLESSPPIRRELPDTDEELFQLEQFALLDCEEALKNCGNNDTMLVELLNLMITQEVPADLEKMKKAFAKKDYSLVEKIAHKIKGGAVYVGTIRMKYACQYLERYWKTGERKLVDPLYHQAVKTIEDSCLYIKDWLKKRHGL